MVGFAPTHPGDKNIVKQVQPKSEVPDSPLRDGGIEHRDMKYTQTTLNKIEKVVDESGYIVRYERGSFQSGFCILEDKKVVVLNKFLPLEGRINTLIDLIPQLKIDTESLSPESRKVYDDIMGRYHAANGEEEA